MPNIDLLSSSSSQHTELQQDAKITLLFLNSDCSKCKSIINKLEPMDSTPGLIIVNTNPNQEIEINQAIVPITKRLKDVFMVHSVPYAIKLKNNIIIDKAHIDNVDYLLQFFNE